MEYWELFLTFRLPHQGILFGYEIQQADEEFDYVALKLHLGLISIEFDYA